MSPVVEGGGGAAAEAEWPCKRHCSQGFRGALDGSRWFINGPETLRLERRQRIWK